eukprot:TRINITY_DN1655_c7_g1_i1.p1 TRINITY_DN1655_c7_g1~~TRINITY_DN1655_c7_g1_i1.p1  ORF type:complete len:442 (-),score=91.93 TRINITY_DN1655_c7_g1_i1:130-1395(-)
MGAIENIANDIYNELLNIFKKFNNNIKLEDIVNIVEDLIKSLITNLGKLKDFLLNEISVNRLNKIKNQIINSFNANDGKNMSSKKNHMYNDSHNDKAPYLIVNKTFNENENEKEDEDEDDRYDNDDDDDEDSLINSKMIDKWIKILSDLIENKKIIKLFWLILLIPVFLYYMFCTISKTNPSTSLTFLFEFIARITSLIALRNMHIELKKNLGVTRTLTRSFQLLSFIGSIIFTTSTLGAQPLFFGGKTILFLLALLQTIGFGWLLILTLAYNLHLPDPGDDSRRMRGVVHWNSLFGYVLVISSMLYVWIKDAKPTIDQSNLYSFLALLGFILSAFGILRGGFKSIMSSMPVLTPYSAVSPLAGATILSTITKLPQFQTSPIMRMYIFGNIAISYCFIIIAFLANKQEKRKDLGSKREFIF